MQETMSRRQRVLAAIEGKPTDRMPIDLGVHTSTGISVFAYKNLREHLGLDTKDIEILDNVQMLARVDEDILERFHIDCMALDPPLVNPKKWKIRDGAEFYLSANINPVLNEKGEWTVESGSEKMRMPDGGYFFDGSWLQIHDYTTFEEELDAFEKRAEYIFKETDYFTMKRGFSAYFNGIDQACDMYTDPDCVIEGQKATLENNIYRFDCINKRYGKYIQAIEVNSDLGAQNAPLIRPEMYEEFCLPYLKEFCKHVHENSDLKIFMHSCGSIEPLIPYIIDAGVDVLNPIQISAENMNPQYLKDTYGSKIAFWGGGCNTQAVLGAKTPDEVRENVRELISIFKPNGKYIFNQVHNILANVPPENIIAMLDEAYKNAF